MNQQFAPYIDILLLLLLLVQSLLPCSATLSGWRTSLLPLARHQTAHPENIQYHYANTNKEKDCSKSLFLSSRQPYQVQTRGEGCQEEANDRIDIKYIMKCSLAGAIACSVSHSLLVPVDNVKTKMQISGDLIGMKTRQVTRQLLLGNGWKGFTKGLTATFTGYFMQGKERKRGFLHH